MDVIETGEGYLARHVEARILQRAQLPQGWRFI
jgi:hypothetical protein